MKKICYITTVSGTLKGFVMPIANYLLEETDWKIYMACNPTDEFVENLPENITLLSIPMERGISLSGIKDMLILYKFFKKEKFDMIQYSTPNASLYASIAGFLARVPVRLYCQWGMVFVGFKGIKRKIFKLEEKIVCLLSTWIEPDSKSNLRFAHKEGLYPENKGSVIWNGSACGVNLTKFDISKKWEYRQKIREEYVIPQDAYVFGFVGRITRDKGINELLEAFKQVEKTDTYLLMVGSEEIDENIDKSLFDWSKNDAHIIYTGRTDVVEQYLSAMDCYVLPSYREGFGMGVVEAEAMGVPVIVTDIPGPTDAMINNETGLVVKKADVETLKNAMVKMNNDVDFCKKCGENSIEFAKNNFEQQQLFQKILEDRKNLLGE